MNRHWAVTLGEVVDPVQTWNPQRAVSGTFDYIDLSAVDQDAKAIIGAAKTDVSAAPSRARQLVRTDDILVSTVRPNLNAVARVPASLDGATASTGFCVLRPSSGKSDAGYLFHWVRSPEFVADMVRNATGASYPAISDRIVKNSVFQFPPLDEQRRIAAILDKADALRQKRKRAIALLDSLTQSIFLEMFGDAFSAEHARFVTAPLKTLTTRITYGFTQPMSHHDRGIPILTGKNILMGAIDYENVHYTSEADFNTLTQKSCPMKGDILVTKDGTIGRAAILDRDGPICINQSVCLVKLDREKVEAEYLLRYILSASVQNRIGAMKKGNSIPHLQITEFANFTVPLPPRELQLEFIDRLTNSRSIRAYPVNADTHYM